MANYKQVQSGSSGSDVKTLQELLNSKGNYNLATDGNFGPKTLAAVKDYQKKNGLAVDGIVGTNTWSKLTTPSSTASAKTTAAAPAQAPTFNYTDSDAVLQADALLQQHIANKPGEWQGSAWTDTLNDTIKQILNREDFSYDLNADALYQQYKDQYTTLGKLAAMDAMGQAAAMGGGYGNSYAQTAGQQAYQGYLQQLNEVVPELYGMALDQHNQEGQALYDQASLLAGMVDQEYGIYQDKLSQYYTDLNYLTENARYMSETEYKRTLDEFNIKYGAYRDTVGDQQWQAQFDEAQRQYNEQFAYQKSQDSIANNLARQQLKVKEEKEKEKEEEEDNDYVVPNYSDWDDGDWEGYFAKIRQSEGQAVAEEELHYFTKNGLIPTKYVYMAAIGARGKLGH